jgi:hypothetical protein
MAAAVVAVFARCRSSGASAYEDYDAVARRILDRLKAGRALRPSADLPPLDLEVHWLVLRAHRGTAGYRIDHYTGRVQMAEA